MIDRSQLAAEALELLKRTVQQLMDTSFNQATSRAAGAEGAADARGTLQLNVTIMCQQCANITPLVRFESSTSTP